jgi:hypothetical protein
MSLLFFLNYIYLERVPFLLSLLGCEMHFLLKILGDYINSKEYRKPEWLIKMEEIKERLAGNHVGYCR